MNLPKLSLLLVLIGAISACQPEIPEEVQTAYEELPQELDFNIHVKPILSDKCFACHGPDKGKIEAGLQLHSDKTAYAELVNSPGKHAIVPGKPGKSEAFHRILATDKELIMPPAESNLTLTDREKAILVKWIEQGAEYKPHWAFVKPEKREVPQVENKEWPTNEIDHFVLAKLETEGIQPSEPADKELLLRRLSLDLTGLPPTPEEIAHFVNNDDPNAYEQEVDRLIASVHYGEKMATDWMDLARYSDTYGYQVDRYRDVSPWRTWVINSFNRNQPYDEFITWQLAGDLLPNPTREQLIATAFNRLHPQNGEGGIVDEEFRVEYVADRASVVGSGFMALTVACAKCHDHKYDPVSQKNFFELYSFFNNVNETGQISWDASDIPVPTMLLPDEKQEKVMKYLESAMAEKTQTLSKTQQSARNSAEEWLKAGGYRSLTSQLSGKVAHFGLDGTLMDNLKGRKGKMDRKFSKNEQPNFVEGKKGKSIQFDGDAWLDLKPVGIYKRNEPFSIGMWVYLPDSLKEGVIFHKNMGARLHSYKGYHLYLRDNKLEMLMAHTWPDNAIEKHTVAEVPRNQWLQITWTYDGSSKADGLKLYLNGEEAETKLIIDNLYKDIIFGNYEDVIYKDPIEPGLKLGGRWRGIGVKNARADEVQVFGRELTALEVKAIANPEGFNQLISKSPATLTEEEKELLKNHYAARLYEPVQKIRSDLQELRTAYVDTVEQVKELMIMKEMDEPRQAYVLERGLYDQYGEEVFPNTPEAILPFPEDLPRNRLGLARWLTHPDHPLTARVAVNRYWQNYFGKGIVKTSEDFGNQGELPSHPELLDWLAIRFMESGWDVKALQKLIVMSASYRQSSIPTPELREMDPDNVLLARGPKARLTSEMIRDNALAASGLLNDEIGGESVSPYQPEGLWKMNGGEYKQDTGDKLYRRSLYTIWKRTVPHPTQATFDQPERNECTVRRQKTNTPLQALVLLNDPTFVEASKKIGEDMCRKESVDQAIKEAYIKLTGRSPMPEELAILRELRNKEYEKFTQQPEKAKGWLAAGEYEVDPSLDSNLIAANAVVASVIINSDATITKR